MVLTAFGNCGYVLLYASRKLKAKIVKLLKWILLEDLINTILNELKTMYYKKNVIL